MKKQSYLVVLFSLLFATSASAQTNDMNVRQSDEIAAEVVREINLVRSNPAAYAANLEAIKKSYKGNIYLASDKSRIHTFEGTAAVDEAIQALRATGPRPALSYSKGMSQAAMDHVKDQGEKGLMSHKGTDGSLVAIRLDRYGNWLNSIGENINYGRTTPREIVISLLIDDGVKGRGHRKNILRPNFSFVGAASGMHAKQGVMTVAVFADDYYEFFRSKTVASVSQKALVNREIVNKKSNGQKE